MSRKLLQYHKHELHFGLNSVNLSDYIKNYKQPLIIYDLAIIKERIAWIQSWRQLGKLHFAVKANFNLDILKLIKG